MDLRRKKSRRKAVIKVHYVREIITYQRNDLGEFDKSYACFDPGLGSLILINPGF